MLNINSVKYYNQRLLRLKNDQEYFNKEAKDLVRDIALDSGDFDDPKDNKRKRNEAYYKRIINAVAFSSAKMLASLLVSHLTNPQQRWFYLDIGDDKRKVYRDEQIWMKKCEDMMYEKFSGTGIHQALHNVYFEGEVFGNGIMVKRKSKNGGWRYLPLTVGQYWIDEDEDGIINSVVRRFAMTCENIISEFGIDNCPEEVKTAISKGERNRLFNIIHFCEPNLNFLPEWDNPYNKPFISTYYVESCKEDEGFLEQKGIKRLPYYNLRWDKYGTNVLGTGIGRTILGDTRMLQAYERDFAKASKKRISPPLKATPDMKNVEKNIGAEGVTYTNNPEGFTPLFSVNYDTQQAMLNIQRIEQRIKEAFFLDIFFAMMTKDKTMSATEAAAVDQEKLVVLGAVTDRIRTEFMDKIVEDMFMDMLEAGEFPPAPESLQGQELNIKYKSVLLQSMEMTDLVAIERYLQFTSQQASFDPTAAMLPKMFEINSEYATKLGVNKSFIHSKREFEEMIQAQAEQVQQQQNEVDSKAVLNNAKAVRELSEANTTAENALTDMMGG